MIPKKPAPDLIRGENRFPAFAKPASAGEGRSEKIKALSKMLGKGFDSTKNNQTLSEAAMPAFVAFDGVSHADGGLGNAPAVEGIVRYRAMVVPERRMTGWAQRSSFAQA